MGYSRRAAATRASRARLYRRLYRASARLPFAVSGPCQRAMMARQTGGLWWGGTDLFPRSSAENRTATAAQAGSVSTTRNLSHAFTDGEWLDMSIITHPMRQYVDPPKGLTPATTCFRLPYVNSRDARETAPPARRGTSRERHALGAALRIDWIGGGACAAWAHGHGATDGNALWTCEQVCTERYCTLGCLRSGPA